MLLFKAASRLYVRFLRYSRISTTSALMFASGNGHREIAQLLIDRGAVVYAQEKVGNCACPIKQYCYQPCACLAGPIAFVCLFACSSVRARAGEAWE